MAIFILGKTTCALCSEAIATDAEPISTTHFIEEPSDPNGTYFGDSPDGEARKFLITNEGG